MGFPGRPGAPPAAGTGRWCGRRRPGRPSASARSGASARAGRPRSGPRRSRRRRGSWRSAPPSPARSTAPWAAGRRSGRSRRWPRRGWSGCCGSSAPGTPRWRRGRRPRTPRCCAGRPPGRRIWTGRRRRPRSPAGARPTAGSPGRSGPGWCPDTRPPGSGRTAPASSRARRDGCAAGRWCGRAGRRSPWPRRPAGAAGTRRTPRRCAARRRWRPPRRSQPGRRRRSWPRRWRRGPSGAGTACGRCSGRGSRSCRAGPSRPGRRSRTGTGTRAGRRRGAASARRRCGTWTPTCARPPARPGGPPAPSSRWPPCW